MTKKLRSNGFVRNSCEIKYLIAWSSVDCGEKYNCMKCIDFANEI
jgi:hypothetical protein